MRIINKIEKERKYIIKILHPIFTSNNFIIGVDASITNNDSMSVVFNMYATRGDLILDSINRKESIPGTFYLKILYHISS